MKTEANTEKTIYTDQCKLLIKFGRTAHAYGIPDARLEDYLMRLSKTFGIDGEFRSTPNHVMFAFRTDDEYWQKINLAAVPGSAFDMTKLAKLDVIVNETISGKLSIQQADAALDEIESIKDPYGTTLTGLGYIFVGAGFAAILSGGWMDIIFSGIFSLIVYFIILAASKKNPVIRSIPITTAFVAGLLSVVCKFYVPQLNYVLVTLSAIIILIPGYSVSVGIAELVNNNTISGMGNLLNGLIYLLKQFTGAWLGFMVGDAILDIPLAPAAEINPIWHWLFLPMLFFGLLIVFQTSAKDFISAFAGCTIGYLGVVYGSQLLGSNFGNLIGAAGIGSYSILWERHTGRPGSIVFLPAIMVLVGGSSGFRGLISAAQGNAAGQNEFMEMFIIAFTITAGLIIANTVFKGKRNF